LECGSQNRNIISFFSGFTGMRRKHLSKTSNKETTGSTSGLIYKASIDLSPKECSMEVYMKTKKVDNVCVPNLECPFTCEVLLGLLFVPCKGYFRTHMNAD
jgi:hypothetical protein